MNDQSEATVYKPPKRSLRQPARRVSHRFRAIDIRLSARLSPDCFPIPFNALVDKRLRRHHEWVFYERSESVEGGS